MLVHLNLLLQLTSGNGADLRSASIDAYGMLAAPKEDIVSPFSCMAFGVEGDSFAARVCCVLAACDSRPECGMSHLLP